MGKEREWGREGVCGVLCAVLGTEAVEQWVLSWRRRLLSVGWIGRAVGQAAAVEYWVLLWKRRLLSSGCSFGDGGSSVLGGWGGLSGGRSGWQRAVERADLVFMRLLVDALL